MEIYNLVYLIIISILWVFGIREADDRTSKYFLLLLAIAGILATIFQVKLMS